MIVEIEIDKTTLPKDGQKVRWQTYIDINNDKWKEGIYIDSDDLFYSTTTSWDFKYHVFHWEPITNKLIV